MIDAVQLSSAVTAIADELAGIREALEALDRRLACGVITTPLAHRLHLALGPCWCGERHSIAEAIALNAGIDIVQPEEGHLAD